MKKFSLFLVLLLLLSCMAFPAHADVLWEPNNTFYEKHRDECTYVNRSYYANGADGYVTLWNSPDGGIVAAQFENATVLRVYWGYEDWGFVTVWQEGKTTDGWIPMSDLVLKYDHIAFTEEYGERITDYKGEFADFDGDISVVNFFPYPGAPEVSISFDLTKNPEILNNLKGREDEGGWSYISSLFVDEQGLTWGFVGYMYGRHDSWFCLDDPDGENFPLRAVYPAPPAAGELPSDEPVESPDVSAPADEPERSSEPDLIPAAQPKLPAGAYLPFALVGVVVVITLVLLAIFFRRRKKPKDDPSKT